MLTKIRNLLVPILMIGMIASGTNPGHKQHRSKTWPGREMVSFPLSALKPLESKDTDQTNYHNYGCFSLTTNRNNGSRTSIGFFRMVFDLRTLAQAEKEREHADAVEISGMEEANKWDTFQIPNLQNKDSTR